MFGQQQNATLPSVPTTVPELGHLKAAAERISQANYNLATFHTRFFGPAPENAAATSQGEPCYRNDLTAVFDQISRLEELVNGLTQIG